MKKVFNPKFLIVVITIMCFTAFNAEAGSFGSKEKDHNHKPKPDKNHFNSNEGTKTGSDCQNKPVSAPIDGGILILLVGGGIAMFGIRKQKS
jgi:hypothetical protein